MTHDGSGTVEMLNTIVPLRELSIAMFWLLFLALLAGIAAVAGVVICSTMTRGRRQKRACDFRVDCCAQAAVTQRRGMMRSC
ncbi:hypothetical protein [Micromonospora sonchi]|uniref:hypothetical protein n=1 Tax=Micromonospora sonchi TaxID=1763543 RepID=UPI001664F4A9|nr:hypothetical protein [Micromonospora sonchi]